MSSSLSSIDYEKDEIKERFFGNKKKNVLFFSFLCLILFSIMKADCFLRTALIAAGDEMMKMKATSRMG